MAICAKTDMNVATISGIVSVKAGSKVDMQSTTTTNIVSGTSQTHTSGTAFTETVGTNAIRNVSGTLTDTITGKGLITMENELSEVKARTITLTQHTHTDPAGIAGAPTSVPNP